MEFMCLILLTILGCFIVLSYGMILIRKDFKEIQEIKKKLKSLKERYTWKPSDEQMYNLSEAAHYRTEFWDCDILIGLYDELKKLREE